MQNIDLNAYSPFHKTGHTSKGDQRKWKIGNVWYKADYMGYEGLSEILVSELLKKSQLQYPFVVYETARIEYGGNLLTACRSEDFLHEGQKLITLEKLFRQYTGESLAVKLTEFTDAAERIKYLVDEIEKITKIGNFGAYITTMLEIDAFFLNEDRHTNNIAVVYEEETDQYFLSPFFDQGLCLFADTSLDYPLNMAVDECLKKIEAKPFCNDFDVQLEAAEELYGIHIRFHFKLQDVHEKLEELRKIYPEEVCGRVENLMSQQIRKYAYLMGK